VCLSVPRTVSRSNTILLEAEYGPDPASHPAEQSAVVRANPEEATEDEAIDRRARVADLGRRVERRKNEKRALVRARRESPYAPAGDRATRQRRRERRLWISLKRQFF